MLTGAVCRRLALCCCLAIVPACDSSSDRGSNGPQSRTRTVNPSRERQVEHATVVRLDPATGRIEALVPVGPDPLLLSVASGRIWTMNFGDGTLSVIDPSSNQGQTVRVGEVVGMTSDSRDVWVAHDDNMVSRLDGATGRKEASVVVGSNPLFEPRNAGFLAVGPDSVWLTVPQLGDPTAPHSLWSLNPETGNVLRRLPLGSDVLPPLIDGRYLWIIAMGEMTATRIDQRSGDATAVPAGPLPLALAAGAGSLWLGHESGEVRQVEPDTLKVTATIETHERLRGTSFGAGMLWVATETGLLAIDPDTDRVALSIRLGDFERDTGPTGIGYLAGSVWVSVE